MKQLTDTTQIKERELEIEVCEVSEPLQLDYSVPKNVLSGPQKWIRYVWHPAIDILSLIGTVVAIATALTHGISWVDIGILLFMFNLIGLSGEAGMHRLFAHKSYKVTQPVRIILALAGSMVGEAPILEYVAYHRRHHIYADCDDDPHSPHKFKAKHPWVRIKNIWYTFIGWKYDSKTIQLTSPEQYAKDLLAEPAIVAINQYFYVIVLAAFLLPAFLGFMISGTVYGAWTAFLWGGCFRFCVMTLMGDLVIRAGCHLFGTQPFVDQTKSQSRNIWFLAIPSLGLSWHNNHHAFPGSAYLSFDWWQIDPSGSFISLLKFIGLASHVKQPTIEQIAAKRLVLQELAKYSL